MKRRRQARREAEQRRPEALMYDAALGLVHLELTRNAVRLFKRSDAVGDIERLGDIVVAGSGRVTVPANTAVTALTEWSVRINRGAPIPPGVASFTIDGADGAPLLAGLCCWERGVSARAWRGVGKIAALIPPALRHQQPTEPPPHTPWLVSTMLPDVLELPDPPCAIGQLDNLAQMLVWCLITEAIIEREGAGTVAPATEGE